MNIRLVFILSVQFIFHLYAYAQEVKVYYPNEAQYNFIYEMTPTRDGYILFVRQTEPITSLFKTDQFGNVVHQIDLSLPNKFLRDISYIIDDGTRYIAMGNLRSNGKSYFATFAFDTALSQITLIDSIAIPFGYSAFTQTIEKSYTTTGWESFGVVQDSTANGNPIVANFGLKLDSNFHFQSFEYIDNPNPDHILEFYWSAPTQQFVLLTFGRDVILLDKELITKRIFTHEIRYFYDQISYISIPKYLDCVPGNQADEHICYGQLLFGGQAPVRTYFATLKTEADTVRITSIFGLDTVSSQIGLANQMRKDSLGHFIVSGVNRLVQQEPNKIRVIRHGSDFQKLAEFTYEDGRQFIIWDMDIDPMNNIIIVGAIFEYPHPTPHSFMLVIDENMVSSFEEIPLPTNKSAIFIYPNPTDGHFCLYSKQKPLAHLQMWDMSGKSVFESEPQSKQEINCFDMPGLQSGVYSLKCQLTDGSVHTTKLIVQK
jgi:Secretion system C-terminal sorting domain